MGFYLNAFSFLTFLSTILLLCIFCVKLIPFFINKKRFPKKLLISLLVSAFVFSGVWVYRNYLFTFNNLQGEFYKGPVHSPTGNYTANAYYMTYGGAAGGVNLWVNITYHDEQEKAETVYYSDAKSNFSMNWKDKNTLSIENEDYGDPDSNRSIDLEIDKEMYDESGIACRSWLMKEKYETCYQNE